MTPPVARRPLSGLLVPLCGVLLALLFAGGIAWQYRALDLTPRAAVSSVTAAEAPSSAYVLANGMRVVVGEDHRAAVVRTMMVYRTGSSLDPAGREGLAHSLEHVMFGGTAGVPARTLYDVTSRMGGQMNAFTGQDETRFVFAAPRGYLDAVLALEADRMQHLRITARSWSTERGAVLAEIGRAQDDPLRVLVSGVRSAAYPGAYGQPSLGRREAVARIGVDALRAAYAQRFTPANATLIVVGDVRAADVASSAKRFFGSIPSRCSAAPSGAPPVPAARGEAAFHARAAVAVPTVDVALRVPGERANDAFDALVLAYALSSDRSPVRRALTDGGIAQSVKVMPDLRAPFGLVHFVVTLSPGHSPAGASAAVDRALRTLPGSAALDDLAREGKAALRSQLALADDDLAARAMRLGWENHAGKRSSVGELDAASPEQVTALLRTVLAAPLVVGELAPSGAAPAQKARPDFALQTPESVEPGIDAGAPAPAPAWLARLLPAPGAALPAEPPATTIALDNGLRVRYVRERGVRGFYLAGFVTGWTSSDPAGKEGLGTATSQLLGAGGKRGDLRRLMAGAAADDLSVQVGQRISAAGPAPRLHDTLAAIGDALMEPSFPDGALDFVRRRMRDAAKSRDTDPDSVANALFDRQLIAADDPALRRPTAASIDALSPGDVQAFAAAHLRPDATVLAVVADADPADVRREVSAAFGGWRRPDTAPPAAQEAIRAWSPSRRVVVVPAQGEHLILGQPVPGTHDERYPSLLLANEILGVGFDSRLLHALRFERGLALSATSKLIANPGRGILRIDTRVPAARSREAAAAIKEEVVRLRRDLVPAQTLARARAQLLAARATAHEQPASLADTALEDEMAAAAGGRSPLARIAGITPERLRADMRALLAPDRLAEVDAGPLR